MSKRGSGSSTRAASFSATELNITGTEKQIAYARDIVQGAFRIMDMNIKWNLDHAKAEKDKWRKKPYKDYASDWKEYKAEMTDVFRKNAKKEIKAADIIDTKYNFQDGVIRSWEQWRRMKGKKG